MTSYAILRSSKDTDDTSGFVQHGGPGPMEDQLKGGTAVSGTAGRLSQVSAPGVLGIVCPRGAARATCQGMVS